MEELKSVLERLSAVQEKINVNAVFGEPRTVEGRTLIPVAEVMYGLGMGFGSGPAEPCCECECDCDCATSEEPEAGCECGCHDEAECECGCHDEADETGMGGGGGAGGRARPVAYIEIGPEGTQVKSIINEQRVALAGILLSAWAVGWVGLVLKTIFTRRR